jgi:hypothetical protein
VAIRISGTHGAPFREGAGAASAAKGVVQPRRATEQPEQALQEMATA